MTGVGRGPGMEGGRSPTGVPGPRRAEIFASWGEEVSWR